MNCVYNDNNAELLYCLGCYLEERAVLRKITIRFSGFKFVPVCVIAFAETITCEDAIRINMWIARFRTLFYAHDSNKKQFITVHECCPRL